MGILISYSCFVKFITHIVLRRFCYNCLARFAISIAPEATVISLYFRLFGPALSIACSIWSVVTTPNSNRNPGFQTIHWQFPLAASVTYIDHNGWLHHGSRAPKADHRHRICLRHCQFLGYNRNLKCTRNPCKSNILVLQHRGAPDRLLRH